MSRIFTTTLRLNLDDEDDRRAWERLHHLDKRQYRSYSKAIVAALNGYFDRQERLAADPYLETREKEDAFLQRVLETIRAGFDHAAPVSSAATLLNLLQNIPPQPASTENATQEDQQEADDTALDFVDSF